MNYENTLVKKVDELIHLHTLDTIDLLYEYYLERLQQQEELQEAKYGVLTVKLIFTNDSLRVDILNASILKEMGINGTILTDSIL